MKVFHDFHARGKFERNLNDSIILNPTIISQKNHNDFSSQLGRAL